MSDACHPQPSVRATIRRGTITLNPWHPGLLAGGPAGLLLDGVPEDVALADLSRLGDGELLVRRVVGRDLSDEAADILLSWAHRAGYTRVWLPDRVVDFDGPAPTGTAAVRCPTCAIRWRDATPEFWETVRSSGWFPGYCCACGGSLPEWELEPAGAAPPAEQRHLREVA